MSFGDVLMTLRYKLFTLEVPSPSDIIPKESLSFVDGKLVIDFSKLNIPFTKTPTVWPAVDIPGSNSMDGIFDYGNNNFLIQPADAENHKIMVDFIAAEWLKSKAANACIYRIMANPADNPYDFSKPAKAYAIHDIAKVGSDEKGRYFKFKGWNVALQDPWTVRDSEILYLSAGTAY
jgi:hypothetical protein